jgi:tRNA pseudouridine32 synthase / 23S rRNA pseudouridine746 synthase
MVAAGAVDGVMPSDVQLPAGDWATMLDALCDRFPAISRDTWIDRMAGGRVFDADGRTIAASDRFRVGAVVRYYREVPAEVPIPFEAAVVFEDEYLLVVDKPHYLPVLPAGEFVQHTLLARLVSATGNADLVPLHRIDRLTAGLVMFSKRPDSRAAYHDLFRLRRIEKNYEALAPALPDVAFPTERRTRLVPGEPFFCMREGEGEPNSQTRIDVVARDGGDWRYSLQPITGRKHQLRVHLAAIGAPIIGDPLYPVLALPVAGDFSRPMKLLAKSLVFDDPITGKRRVFQSERTL